ncbi:MAG: NMD3-related protein [Candidatus Micrarchaeia archaeon]
MDKKCPSCGANSSNQTFVGSFCIPCYSKKLRISLPEIEIEECERCGRIKHHGEWCKKTKKVLVEKIHQLIKTDCELSINIKNNDAELLFLLRFGDTLIPIRKEIHIRTKKAICDTCFRRASGYYEAIIQLRGEKARVNKLQKKLIWLISKNSFVSRVERLPEGVNLYVGSRKVADAALTILSLDRKISGKLHGIKDGRRIYRITYCVRV